MRESLGVTKPKGEVKAKVHFCVLRYDPGSLIGLGAIPARPEMYLHWGGARAHMLKPERW